MYLLKANSLIQFNYITLVCESIIIVLIYNNICTRFANTKFCYRRILFDVGYPNVLEYIRNIQETMIKNNCQLDHILIISHWRGKTCVLYDLRK